MSNGFGASSDRCYYNCDDVLTWQERLTCFAVGAALHVVQYFKKTYLLTYTYWEKWSKNFAERTHRSVHPHNLSSPERSWPHLIHGSWSMSTGPLESICQMAPRSVYPFCGAYGCVQQADTLTTLHVYSNRPHLCTQCMRYGLITFGMPCR